MSTQAMKQAHAAIAYLMAGSYRSGDSGPWARVSMPKDKALDMGAAAIDALREAIQLAEAKTDEPVAWRAKVGDLMFHAASREGLLANLQVQFKAAPDSIEPLYTRPAAVPMTDAGVDAMRSALEWIARVNAMDYEYQRVAKEALSAITAQPKKETP